MRFMVIIIYIRNIFELKSKIENINRLNNVDLIKNKYGVREKLFIKNFLF